MLKCQTNTPWHGARLPLHPTHTANALFKYRCIFWCNSSIQYDMQFDTWPYVLTEMDSTHQQAAHFLAMQPSHSSIIPLPPGVYIPKSSRWLLFSHPSSIGYQCFLHFRIRPTMTLQRWCLKKLESLYYLYFVVVKKRSKYQNELNQSVVFRTWHLNDLI